MDSNRSTISSILFAVAIATGVSLAASFLLPSGEASKQSAAPATKAMPKATWVAAAPGRVEPRSGEIRVGSQMPGRIEQVAVQLNETVMAGDLLIRLADDDALARLRAAEAEAAVRRRERDTETVGKPASDRRQAEDAAAAAERAVARARADLDEALAAYRKSNSESARSEASVRRNEVTNALNKLEAERSNLRRVSATQGMPLPTRLEAALTAARADLSLAEAAFERTRIRAPVDATVLQISARIGETASPSPDQVLIQLGDLSSLRVRGEVEERDAAKVRVGQLVMVRSDAFPGRDFEGKVAAIAKALGPAKLSQRGPRRPNDIDVMEAIVELTGSPPLLPGMRVDVLFKPDATAQDDSRRTN